MKINDIINQIDEGIWDSLAKGVASVASKGVEYAASVASVVSPEVATAAKAYKGRPGGLDRKTIATSRKKEEKEVAKQKAKQAEAAKQKWESMTPQQQAFEKTFRQFVAMAKQNNNNIDQASITRAVNKMAGIDTYKKQAIAAQFVNRLKRNNISVIPTTTQQPVAKPQQPKAATPAPTYGKTKEPIDFSKLGPTAKAQLRAQGVNVPESTENNMKSNKSSKLTVRNIDIDTYSGFNEWQQAIAEMSVGFARYKRNDKDQIIARYNGKQIGVWNEGPGTGYVFNDVDTGPTPIVKEDVVKLINKYTVTEMAVRRLKKEKKLTEAEFTHNHAGIRVDVPSSASSQTDQELYNFHKASYEKDHTYSTHKEYYRLMMNKYAKRLGLPTVKKEQLSDSTVDEGLNVPMDWKNAVKKKYGDKFFLNFKKDDDGIIYAKGKPKSITTKPEFGINPWKDLGKFASGIGRINPFIATEEVCEDKHDPAK